MSAAMQIEVLGEADILARRVAEWMIDCALEQSGDFAIALSGGSTPRGIYEHLAAPASRERFPWTRAHWFWGDERFVPHQDARSNFRMAWEALLSRAPVPAGNIHAVPVENVTPQDAAAAYERALKDFYGAEALDPARPLFAIALLGLGEDGHFASLFPGAEALDEHRRWAIAVIGAQPEPRITLTYPALECSAHAAFLVAGASKSAILRRFRAGDPALPARRFHPKGELRLFADSAAAGMPSS
jgi:6-phosphogluconolactonase